jgi:hypothetical protein
MKASVLTRLEYLTPEGWAIGHAGIALLDPEAYVKRLRARGKFGRATVLNDRLQPTGEIYVAEGLPDPSTLVKPDDGTRAPVLPELCDDCSGYHKPPFDGGCLI